MKQNTPKTPGQDQTRHDKPREDRARLRTNTTYRLVVEGEGARGHDLLHVLAVPELHEGVPAAVLPLTQVNPKHQHDNSNSRTNERPYERTSK